MNFHFNRASLNRKTGVMPVVTSSRETCPPECPLWELNICYAKHSWMGIHWRKVSSGERGESFADVIAKIKRIAKGVIWRWGVAGDLPGEDGFLAESDCYAISLSNGRSDGYAYTHYSPYKGNNRAIIKAMNSSNFTVNLSSDTLTEADDFVATGLPVVTLLPVGAPKVSYTPGGNKVVKCPAIPDKVTCSTCKLCTKKDRDFIVGFEAHGTGRNAINKLDGKSLPLYPSTTRLPE